jgi:hypothetical protein
MSKLRRAATVALAGIAAMLFTVSTATPAQAWTWNSGVTVYNAGLLCVQGDAGIDHAVPGTLSGNLAYANTYGRSAGCVTGLVGWSAAVRLDVYKWTGWSWYVCRNTDWSYGTTGVNQFGPTGPTQTFNYGGASACGSGYYGTMGYSYVWDGSTWRGGHVWSGAELVP